MPIYITRIVLFSMVYGSVLSAIPHKENRTHPSSYSPERYKAEVERKMAQTAHKLRIMAQMTYMCNVIQKRQEASQEGRCNNNSYITQTARKSDIVYTSINLNDSNQSLPPAHDLIRQAAPEEQKNVRQVQSLPSIMLERKEITLPHLRNLDIYHNGQISGQKTNESY